LEPPLRKSFFARLFFPACSRRIARVTPTLASARDQYLSKVVENVPLCREHYRLLLGLPEFPPTEPGQFIQISCRDREGLYNCERELDWRTGEPLDGLGVELLHPLAYLRRPFSLAGRSDEAEGVRLEIIHRVVGVGTQWMADLRVGEQVDVLGPLGNRFRLPDADEIPLLVGGGVGIPPMLYLAQKLEGKGGIAFCGALSCDLLPMTITAAAGDAVEPLENIEEFARHRVRSVISTDDGSYGFRGFVTQALERYLDTARPSHGRPVIYTCGPEPMMKRVAQIAADRGIECQVAVERAMACGMGTCQSCCIRLRRDPQRDGQAFEGKDWIYKLACTDGPIFLGKDLLW
jgi:dihydroorotate dehydrogenase electron transfer subunit